jgi:hypothetical protein
VLIRPHPDVDGNFKVFAKDPFDRTTARSHINDYRWGINMRSKHLDAYINDGAKPTVILKTGVLFTPDLTKPSLIPKLTCPTGGTEELKQIATHFAVSIPSATKVAIEWKDQGNKRKIYLPRPGEDERTIYTLYLINEPQNFDGFPHDELPLYYKVLESGGAEIPDTDQCKLKFEGATRSDEIPCMPIVLNP